MSAQPADRASLMSNHMPEPIPPPPGPLFESHEVMAFEQFLDDLAIDNSFMFHPKVPVSLTWDGFQTTRNKGFEDIKREHQHSGLQFGSDNHFSSDGYIATHKYVPVGYGHVHPQSTAQRSARSSDSSRVQSRRPSVYNEIANYSPMSNVEPPTFAKSSANGVNKQFTLGIPRYPDHNQPILPYFGNMPGEVNNHDEFRVSTYDTPLMPSTTVPPHSHLLQQYPLVPDVSREWQSEASMLASEQSTKHSRAPDADHGYAHSSDIDGLSTPSKRAKLEEQPSKQPLSAAQKRQNHISSEQKRRNLIKEGFNDLCALVPRVQNKNESKSVILHEAIAFIRANDSENDALRARLKSLTAMRRVAS